MGEVDDRYSRGGRRSYSSYQPSGEDANPLNSRLPAETVSRRRRPERSRERREPEPEQVLVDLRSVLDLNDEARVKWLSKALRAAEEERVSAFALYNTITSPKFVQGVPHKIGRKLAGTLSKYINVFSEKQQRFLRSEEDQILTLYRDENQKDRQTNSDPKDSEDAAKAMEEMMARCRAFVRDKADTYEDRKAELQTKVNTENGGSDMDTEAPPMPWEPPPTPQDPPPVPYEAPPLPPVPEEPPPTPEEAAAAEQAKREAARRKKREREEADLALMRMHEQNLKDAETEAKQPKLSQTQMMEDADSSLMLLERLSAKQRSPSPKQTTRPRSPARAGDDNGFGRNRAPARRSRSRSRSAKRHDSRDRGRSSRAARPRSDSRSYRKRPARASSPPRQPRARSRSLGARVPRRLMYQEGARSQPIAPMRTPAKPSKPDRSNSRSSSSSSGGLDAQRKKDAINARMKQWDKEEKVQREFFGWKPSQ